jgi:hypothetical protein
VPLNIKHRKALPLKDVETVHVCGLDIPLDGDLPYGAQIELFDHQNRFNLGEIGQFEYLMRAFCVFTWRLPAQDRVRYHELAERDPTPEQMAELVNGTLALLKARAADAGEDEGNALETPKRGKKATSTPSA